MSAALCSPHLAAGHDWWQSTDPDELEAARHVCRSGNAGSPCPIKAACLRAALDRGEADGIWAGLDAAEREALPTAKVRVRVRGRAACGTAAGYQTCTQGEDGFMRCRKCRRAHARAVAGYRQKAQFADTFRDSIDLVEEPTGQLALVIGEAA